MQINKTNKNENPYSLEYIRTLFYLKIEYLQKL